MGKYKQGDVVALVATVEELTKIGMPHREDMICREFMVLATRGDKTVISGQYVVNNEYIQMIANNGDHLFKIGDKVKIIAPPTVLKEFCIEHADKIDRSKEYEITSIGRESLGRPTYTLGISKYGPTHSGQEQWWFRQIYLRGADVNNIELMTNVEDVELKVGEHGAYITVEGQDVLVGGKLYDVMTRSGNMHYIKDDSVWRKRRITVSTTVWEKE